MFCDTSLDQQARESVPDVQTTVEVDVSSGEVASCPAGGVLHAGGIGSCVVVSAWDAVAVVGGMAHVMLPGDRKSVV